MKQGSVSVANVRCQTLVDSARFESSTHAALLGPENPTPIPCRHNVSDDVSSGTSTCPAARLPKLPCIPSESCQRGSQRISAVKHSLPDQPAEATDQIDDCGIILPIAMAENAGALIVRNLTGRG